MVATAGVGEATEGLIVRVVGTIIQPPTSDLPFGFKFTVDDGSGELQIFVNAQTGIDLSGLAGMVTFQEGGTALAQVPLNASGAARLTTTSATTQETTPPRGTGRSSW